MGGASELNDQQLLETLDAFRALQRYVAIYGAVLLSSRFPPDPLGGWPFWAVMFPLLCFSAIVTLAVDWIVVRELRKREAAR